MLYVINFIFGNSMRSDRFRSNFLRTLGDKLPEPAGAGASSRSSMTSFTPSFAKAWHSAFSSFGV